MDGDDRENENLSEWKVRRACLDDLEAIYALSHECFSWEAWAVEGLRSELEREPLLSWVAETTEGEIIAYSIAHQVAGEAELLQIATSPSHRRKGLGDKLMSELQDELRSVGIGLLSLEVRATNAAARAFYLKWGFEALGLRRSYYREPTDDAIVMVRSEGGTGQVA